MLELTIKDQVYSFNFGMGFMRELNKRMGKPIDGIPGEKENVGLQFRIAGVLAGDVEALVDVLDVANRGQNPRITVAALDAYIDDETTDIDSLFELVIESLKTANATKKVTEPLLEALEERKAEAAARKAAKG